MSDAIATPPAPTSRCTQEVVLLVLVSLMAIAANLPRELLEISGLRPGHLIALLGFIVVLALFLYLRFFFFLLYVLLAIGANVPSQWAEALGISQLPLLITLIAMVGLSLLNYVVKLLPNDPTDTLPAEQKHSTEGSKALFGAIERGNILQLRQVLAMNFDPNIVGEDGLTPLMLAAQSGNPELVNALLAAGADPRTTNAGSQTARDLAFRKGHVDIVRLLTPPS